MSSVSLTAAFGPSHLGRLAGMVSSYEAYMKRIVLAILLLVAIHTAAAQDSTVPEPTQNPNAPYRLFRTQNIFTFLKLDTRTGQIWQVQWGLDDEHRFTVPLNQSNMVSAGAAHTSANLRSGRFTLFPTENIHTFLLLDTEDGKVWQIQWGEEGHRLITPVS
jgi:hypothetical protein